MIIFLILSFFAHFVCDFTALSSKKMLKAKANFNSFTDFENLLGIVSHASVHGFAQFLIAIPFIGWSAILFGAIHILFHTIIDCLKPLTTNFLVSKNIKASDITNVWFWTVFGLDQFMHNLTIIIIIFIFI
jgi:hypothetical protein